jgi:hypothetical protein
MRCVKRSTPAPGFREICLKDREKIYPVLIMVIPVMVRSAFMMLIITRAVLMMHTVILRFHTTGKSKYDHQAGKNGID